MICPSPPLRALLRPTPPLARLKGRALVGRDFIFQMRFAHGSAMKKWAGRSRSHFRPPRSFKFWCWGGFAGFDRFPVVEHWKTAPCAICGA